MTLKITETGKDVTVHLKVVPGSSRTRIASVLGTALKVNIATPAEKGKANKELLEFFSTILDCPKSSLTITTGQNRPQKKLAIVGLTAEQLLAKLAPHLPTE